MVGPPRLRVLLDGAAVARVRRRGVQVARVLLDRAAVAPVRRHGAAGAIAPAAPSAHAAAFFRGRPRPRFVATTTPSTKT